MIDVRSRCRRDRRRVPRNAGLLAAAVAIVLAGACAEWRSERAYGRVIDRIDEAEPSDLRERLVQIEKRWPGTDAAAKASREIEWIDDLRHISARAPALMAWDAVREVANGVERFKLRHGRYPDRIDELVPRFLREPVVDLWDNPVQYQRHAHGYRVICFGEDGIPGGTGLASDVLVETGREVKIGGAAQH